MAKKYIRRDIDPFIEAMYLTRDNYKEVCAWMGYDEFQEDGDGGVKFFKRSSQYNAKYNTWIVGKGQTMSDEKFNNTYMEARLTASIQGGMERWAD